MTSTEKWYARSELLDEEKMGFKVRITKYREAVRMPHWDWLSEKIRNAFLIHVMSQPRTNYNLAKVKTGNGINSSGRDEIEELLLG
jgi:hypothetical protein